MRGNTFIRFITHAVDPNSTRRLGLFHATGNLQDANVLAEYEAAELMAVRDWFDKHLERPDRFARSTKTGAASRAIGWFKSDATEHIKRMHQMCRLLNEHGIATEMLTTSRPGYIVYEDEHQVAAEPYAETET